jgi:hypothetical protein
VTPDSQIPAELCALRSDPAAEQEKPQVSAGVLTERELLLQVQPLVLTKYFPVVDDGVVTYGEYEVPRRSLTGPSAFGESQGGSPKATLEHPPGSDIGGA